MTEQQTEPWWTDHRHLALLAEYLVERLDCDLDDVIYMLGKPWKYDGEFRAARADHGGHGEVG